MHRIEVTDALSPSASHETLLADAPAVFPAGTTVRSSHLYLLESDLSEKQVEQIARELLADPVAQHFSISPHDLHAREHCIEVHHLPGVMDPAAASTKAAIAELIGSDIANGLKVQTATRYVFAPPESSAEDIDLDALMKWAQTHLGNTVVHAFYDHAYLPERFVSPVPYRYKLTHVPLDDLDDPALLKLSREAHFFLSLEEMQTIQQFFRDQPGGPREPTDIELETIAQTWSEHCVHKTLKATVDFTPDGCTPDRRTIFDEKPGHTRHADGTVTIDNLLKSTIAAATRGLREQHTDIDHWLISVFDDNAGVVRFDETYGIAIKVETHNHPSAIEPYGGAATGIGGCIRDIMGTGLVAKPIANTDVFAVAHLDHWTESNPPAEEKTPLPAGVLHPTRVLRQIVGGVRDYGNRMGIPTVNGAVVFHDDYVANPLVYAGCVGLIPLKHAFGDPQPGDRIVALGGRTGRDGIHGATFSSAELTDTHADEFAHAVQIGNAITQKRVLDVLLQARDAPQGPLFTAITDCGAGGFSSAIGEMGEKLGAEVTLDTAPLKYPGLSYTEVWISEAQERMVLSVPPDQLDALQALCDAEHVELADLGAFGCLVEGQPTLRLRYHRHQVGELPMAFLHNGLPKTSRAAVGPAHHQPPAPPSSPTSPATGPKTSTSNVLVGDLLALLAHPNIASKHRIIRQYDHEVQGGTVVKPLVGPQRIGPSDAAVIKPRPDSNAGIAIASGLAPWLAEKTPGGDSYQATLHAVDEAVRNAVCVGAQPFGDATNESASQGVTTPGIQGIAILDNFCWPSCDTPESLGTLVRSAEACYDAAMAYRTPFVSGKDSLHNQFTTDDGRLITIPPTLLVTALGMVPDVRKAVTMDAKRAGSSLVLVGQTTAQLGGSHLTQLGRAPADSDLSIPCVDLDAGPRHALAVASLIARGMVLSAHDCSDGGLLVAAAEMAMAGGLGLDLTLHPLTEQGLVPAAAAFAESPSRYLLEVSDAEAALAAFALRGVPAVLIGTFTSGQTLAFESDSVTLTQLIDTWRNALHV